MKRAKDAPATLDSVLDTLETVVTSVLIVICIFTFVFKMVTVSGESMEDTLYDDDRLLMWNFFYTPKNGDIVVVRSKILDKLIVKRVIAVSGQKVVVDYEDDKVYVCDNDKEPEQNDLLAEGYLKQSDIKDPETFFSEEHFDKDNSRYVYTVPTGYVFIMGDNRNASTDSRALGLIDLNDVEGKVILRYASPKGKKSIGFVK